MKKIILPIIFLLMARVLFAASPLSDPLIPDNERISYSIFKGEDYSQAIQTVIKMEADKGRFWYKITLNSPSQDVEVHIQSDNFLPFHSRRVQKNGRTEYRTVSEIKSVPEIANDEILLVDFNDLTHLLRGYPFSDPKTLTLVFPYNPEKKNNEKDSITFRVKYIKEETLDIGSRSYDAYKLQLSAKMTGGMAVFSALMPKTFFWYSLDKPHYLLKYEGQSGMGNSETMIMEIESYKAGS